MGGYIGSSFMLHDAMAGRADVRLFSTDVTNEQ
jgi:hypothetical protein